MSCGNCHGNRIDLTGNTYGKLYVIGPDNTYISNESNGWKSK